MKEEIRNMPISILGLTTRTRNAIARHRIYEGEYDHLEPVHVRSRLPQKSIRFVGDILDMEPEEWMDIRNFGEKSRVELISKLIDIGMKYEKKTETDELDADHKMYHYISDIVETLEDIMTVVGGNTAWEEKADTALHHAKEIKEYLQTILEIKIMFIEGPK